MNVHEAKTHLSRLLDTHVLLWWLFDDDRLDTDDDDLAEEIERQGFAAIPVTVADGLAAGALPRHHADPFDRMLIAQAARRRLAVAVLAQRSRSPS